VDRVDRGTHGNPVRFAEVEHLTQIVGGPDSKMVRSAEFAECHVVECQGHGRLSFRPERSQCNDRRLPT